MYIWFLLLYYKMTKMGNKLKKANFFFFIFVFFFCFTECKYAVYLMNQHRQLTNGKNICDGIFG